VALAKGIGLMSDFEIVDALMVAVERAEQTADSSEASKWDRVRTWLDDFANSIDAPEPTHLEDAKRRWNIA